MEHSIPTSASAPASVTAPHDPCEYFDQDDDDEDFSTFSNIQLNKTTDHDDNMRKDHRTNTTYTTTSTASTIISHNSSSSTSTDRMNADMNLPNQTMMTPRKRYVTPQDFELLKVIGMGAFGKVLQVRNKKTQKIHAMKVISKRLLKKKPSYIANMQAESEIMTKVKHPFIVTMHCSFQTREKLFIVMEFLAGGELFLRLGREGIFLESTAKFYIAEIVLALEYLHSKGILHRDLKPENILLGSDGHLCLTDFGLAKDFGWDKGPQDEDGRALTVCGTQEYMAPEMVARKGYTKAADWWSLGCIAYEMLAGNPPFESKKGAKDLFEKIMTEKVKMPIGSSAAACVLLKGLLNRNTMARLGAAKSTMFQVGGVAQIKQLAFFSSMDWMKLEKKELHPPMASDVHGDEDLRHFYDEFKNMSLPRSVKLMADDKNFKPKQCQSEAFKGFSFIQADFDLPDRTDEQHDHYWNNAEADGESASDTASSMGDDDEWMQPLAPHKPTLEPTPEISEKKKRPPRKKKTKAETITADVNQPSATPTPTVQSESSTMISDTHSTANFHIGDDTSSHVIQDVSQSKPSPVPPISEASQTSTKIVEELKEVISATPKPHPTVSAWETVSKSKAKALNPSSLTTRSSSLKPNAPIFKPGSNLKVLSTSASTPKSFPTSDWRSHKISVNTSKLPPPLSNSNEFPALGNFPLTPNTKTSNFKEDFPALSDFPSLTHSGATNAVTKRSDHNLTLPSAWGIKR